MSFMRLPKFQRVGSSWESIVDFFTGKKNRRAKGGHNKNRRLMLDPLEERMLLSLSVGNLHDQFVNQSLIQISSMIDPQTNLPIGLQDSTTIGSTVAGRSVAAAHNGDFVTVWTQNNYVIDPATGSYYTDPATGNVITDSNIYARYFTDEVQRITLPAGSTKFSLVYGGNMTQKITFSSQSSTSVALPDIQGVFKLAFDMNNDGLINNPADLTTFNPNLPVEVTKAIDFNELYYSIGSAYGNYDPATAMQEALRSLGGIMADVKVAALSPRELQVEFGDASQNFFVAQAMAGGQMPKLRIIEPAWVSDSTVVTGYTVDIVRQPTLIGNSIGIPLITVSSNPATTATAIEQYFALTTKNYPYATIDVVSPDYGTMSSTGAILTDREPVAKVKVTPVTKADGTLDLYSFDITFVDNSGKMDHPQLQFGNVIAGGNSLPVDQIGALNVTNIKTTKEPGPEFRVNPDEPDNPDTPLPEITNQSNPSVAMDADGDFVITWQSEVPDSVNPGSQIDVFARRYSPAALLSTASGIANQNLIISSTDISVAEGGSNGSFLVRLAGAPTVDTDGDGVNDVTVTISPNLNYYFQDSSLTYDTDLIQPGNQNTLKFTTDNWNIPQAITFSAAEDLNRDSGDASYVLSAPDYASQTIKVKAVDNDPAAILISTNDISVLEGSSNSFTVQLNADPGRNVTISVMKRADSDPDITTPDNVPQTVGVQYNLQFNSSNWNIPQIVTFNAADETRATTNQIGGQSAGQDADRTNGTAYFYIGELDPLIQSGFNRASGYAVQTITAHEIEVPRIVVSNNNITIPEATLGGTQSVTVKLDRAPTSPVTVTISPMGNANGFTAPGSITLNANNWQNGVPLTITGPVADANTINETATFLLYAPGYANQTISVTCIDWNTTSNFVITPTPETPPGWTPPTPLMISEGGNVTFNLALNASPLTDATITFTVLGANNVTVGAQTLTFTADADPDGVPNSGDETVGNWATPQTVTINAAVNAPVQNPAQNDVAVVNITSSDPGFGPLDIPVITLEPQMIVLSNMYVDLQGAFMVNDVNVLEGGTANFAVSLALQPLTNWSVYVTAGGGDSDLTAITQRLDFTPGNWNQPQTVTLLAARDNDALNGARTFTLSAQGVPDTVVTAYEIDIPSITVSPTGLPILENSSGSININLSAAPTAQIKVDITKVAVGDADITTSVASVNVPVSNALQPVTVSAADDSDTTSGQGNFLFTAPGYTVSNFTGIEVDDDISPVQLIPDTVSVKENGTNTYAVKLAQEPAADTTITITLDSSTDADISLLDTDPITAGVQNTLTFTANHIDPIMGLVPGNWSQTQYLTFSAANDALDVDGSAQFNVAAQMGTFTFDPTSTDLKITVNEIDDDHAFLDVQVGGVSVDPAQIAFVEVLEGSTGTFEVALPTAPTTNITVTVTAMDGGDPDLFAIPQTLYFTADSDPDGVPNSGDETVGNWNIPQKVKILAKSDPDTTNGTTVFTISAPGYNSRTITAVEKDYLQTVRPLGSAFQVNTFTANEQQNPTVAMDKDGNFVIAWENRGQSISYFNGITAQRFNRDGDRLGSEFMVNASPDTEEHHDPYVAMSQDGHFLVTWVRYTWSNPLPPPDYFDAVGAVQAVVYNPDGSVQFNEFNVGGGGYPTASFDHSNRFLVTWSASGTTPHDTLGNTVNPTNVYARMFADAGTGAPNEIRATFRVNSGDLGTSDIAGTAPRWSGYQLYSSAALDADGDIIITYEGYGPDVSNNASVSSQWYSDAANDPVNADISSYLSMGLSVGTSSGDVDAEIDAVLNQARSAGLNADQIGRIYSILNSVATLNRGEGNGVMYTSLNADPQSPNNLIIMSRDAIVNSQRDGQNQRMLLSLDPLTIDGNVILHISNAYVTGNGRDVTFGPAYLDNNGGIDNRNNATANNLRDAITDSLYTGVYWPRNDYEGPVKVTLLSAADVADRGLDSTQYYYEITFQGDLHDNNSSYGMSLSYVRDTLQRRGPVDGADNVDSVPLTLTTITEGSAGTEQHDASVAMTPSGSFVVAWSQNDVYSSSLNSVPNTPGGVGAAGTTIQFRTLKESSDTAGPEVTDYLLTDGTRLRNNGQITDSALSQYMIVSFDEPMMTTGTGSVTNVNNWALMKNGVKVNGGISKIYYGMNMASQMGVGLGSNRYEAVLLLDGNGATAGTPALTNGHYQLVAFNTFKDVAGNPLGRTGNAANGANFTRDFDVAVIGTSDTQVNTATAGNQTTSSAAPVSSGKTVASDGSGRSVVVWVTENQGVYAKTFDSAGAATSGDMLVSADIYAASAAVAMDADGDFVVTWSSNKNDPNDTLGTSWDVYAQRFNAAGAAQGDVINVNTETEDIQRNSSVAMDAAGDFMITWQSMDQDGSGYGIYAQRYNPAGEVLDGINEAQIISLIGRPEGTFKLKWVDASGTPHTSQIVLTINHDETITLSSEPTKKYSFDVAIQKVMEDMGATVKVSLIYSTEILVQFTGTDGSKDQNLIEVDSATWTAGDPGKRIEITTQVEGQSGEIRVNDTTIGDQVSPSIAASLQGVFVVTWTGYGQDGDAAYESNVYMKEFQAGGTSEFDIVIQLSGGLTPSQEAIFELAANRWESIIVGDIPDVNSPVYGYIDDVLIDASGEDIDGPGGILGMAGPDEFRNGSFLPDHGIMMFDTADLADMEANGSLLDVIIHEMAHVLGFGTIWTALGVYINGSGQYTGAAALASYRTEFVGQQDAAFVPVELAGGGGTANGHWNESDDGGPTGIVDTQGRDMQFELMTGWLDSPIFMSKTTAYQFQDLGYVVNAGAAVNFRQLGSSSPNPITGWMEPLTGQHTYVDALPSTVGGGKTTAKLGSLPEARVNSTIVYDQKWSSVAADANGDFVISWTSYGQDGTGSGPGAGANGENGVYARRFSSGGAALSDDFKVNTFGANDQQHSQVSMDADGDFAIVWESFQDRPAVGSGLPDSPNSFGVYGQRYAATSKLATTPFLGPNGEIGSEFRLNSTTTGDQRYPSVAMDAAGNMVAVWSGNGSSDSQGVFSQRYMQTPDTAGPFVTEVLNSDAGNYTTINQDEIFATSVSNFKVIFDEAVVSATSGATFANSVRNVNNWTLTRNGAAVTGAIQSVTFNLNVSTNKYEAIITFDSNFETTTANPLGQGFYTLTLSQNVQDLLKNALDGNLDGTPGGDFVFNFSIDIIGHGGTQDDPPGSISSVSTTSQNGRTYAETPGAVAVDADGNHVVVWTATDNTPGGHDRIYLQIFDADGTAADLPLYNFDGTYNSDGAGNDAAPVMLVTGDDSSFNNDDQRYASVAMDADGDFVVTWTNYRNGNADIYARRFNSMAYIKGLKKTMSNDTTVDYDLTALQQNSAFRVNSYTTGEQKWSNVVMDTVGDFVITWSSKGQENNGQGSSSYGVYAARYNSSGNMTVPEFQVNTTTNGDQYHSSAAMLNNGFFFVVFEGAGMETTGHDIFIRAFDPLGKPTANEYDMQYFYNELGLTAPNIADYRYPDIASTPNGENIVLTYQTLASDGLGWEIKASTLQFYPNNVLTNPYLLPIVLPYQLDMTVNSTAQGDQQYPSVAVDYNGGFVVSWSGYGNRAGQSDVTGDGVFYQRFNFDPLFEIAGRVGGERRANVATTGNQRLASVGSDAEGNVVIAFTGVDATDPNKTAIYKTVTATSVGEQTDSVGPIITDVLMPDRTQVLNGHFFDMTAAVNKLIVVFSEDMMMGTGSTGANSIINSSNWALYRNGSEVVGAISYVSFGYNPTTHKYEATVTFNPGAVVGGSSTELNAGEYKLLLKGNVVDKAVGTANALSTTAFVASGQVFTNSFVISGTPQLGPEFRVNDQAGAQYNQSTGSVNFGSYNNIFTTTARSVAVDDDGDFAVVWTSFGQDGDNAGVYMRMYDRNGNPLTTNDIRVNTYTAGNQNNPSIAMDADGDFIVTWASQGQDADGSWGVYAQRFNSMGQFVDAYGKAGYSDDFRHEFQVNTNYIGDQFNPEVAMNASGQFVIVWANKGQTSSYFNDIRGQLYDADGHKVGSEFRANSDNFPSVWENEINPTVAMDSTGNFTVVWEQPYMLLIAGELWDTYIAARMFDNLGNPRVNNVNNTNGDFRIDTAAQGINFLADLWADHQQPCDITGINSPTDYMKTARNPSIIMDANGNFIIGWESFIDNDVTAAPTLDAFKDYGRSRSDSADSYGVFFRRFSANGTAMTANDHNANFVDTVYDTEEIIQDQYTNGEQVNISLALDADGDMVAVYSGNGATWGPSTTYLPTEHDTDGVFVRDFWPSSYPDETGLNSEGMPNHFGSTVNRTISGSQSFPYVAMARNGTYVVVWSGTGIGDSQGVFARRYVTSLDNAGPMVADFLLPDGTRIGPNNQVTQSLSSLKIVFDEDMMPGATGGGVLNPANYRLLKNGVALTGGITSIDYGLDPSTNKYVATIHVDANGLAAGVPEMNDGQYQLVVLNSIRDKAGNPLQSNGTDPNGGTTSRTITFNVADANNSAPINGSIASNGTATASDANGDKIVVWTSAAAGKIGIYAQLYRTTWTSDVNGRQATVTPQGGEILITGNATATDVAVAIDADGDFIVTWSQQKSVTDATYDVYARRYNSAGQTLGNEFMVNTYTVNNQINPSVAVDVDGDFVITWQSYEQDGSGWGIYAQRYDSLGNRIGGVNEAQSIQFVGTWTGTFTLSMDADNNPLTPDIKTAPIAYAGNAAQTASDIITAFASLGVEVTTTEVGTTMIYVMFTGPSGYRNQAPLWVSTSTIDPGKSGQIQLATVQDGSGGELRVNDTTLRSQTDPSIAMSAEGNFVISWTSEGQDGDGASNTNVYAKQFVRNQALNTGNAAAVATGSMSSGIPGAQYDTYIVTVDEPANHAVVAGQGADGIVQVLLPGGYGSGTLLTLGGRTYIITAAHVVWNDALNQAEPAANVSVAFDMPTGRVTIPASVVYVNPGYNGDPFGNGNDIAIIQMTASAPTGAASYDIYRNSDEIGQVGVKYGYGLIGTGATGSVNPSGDVKHTGQNKYESLGSILGFSDNLLVYDFDNGQAANDAFGVLYNINDLGLGINEASAAPGDSGGPTFVNNKIAAVCTGGVTIPGPQDILPGVNSSYGDFGVDTRVSLYADWIDTITSGSSGQFLVNENVGNTNNISNDQKWSSVSMDSNGDFVISWTSYGHDRVGTGYGPGVNGENGVFARRYHMSGTPMSDAIQVNTVAEGDQQRSKVQMDAGGDFVVAWETDNVSGKYNVAAKRFVRTELVGNAMYGANGEIGGEFTLTTVGLTAEPHPSLAVDYTGDLLTVWSDGNSVYQKQFSRPSDDAGAIVTEVKKQDTSAKLTSEGANNDIIFTSTDLTLHGLQILTVNSTSESIEYSAANRTLTIKIVAGTTTANSVVSLVNSKTDDYKITAALAATDGTTSTDANNGTGKVSVGSTTMVSKLTDGITVNTVITQMIVTFSEDMLIGSSGLTNPANWTLVQNTKAVVGPISNVTFARNATTGKFEATVVFSSTLTDGSYVLTLKDTVLDAFGNKLDGDYSGTPGVNYTLSFSINSGTSGGSGGDDPVIDPNWPTTITIPGNPTDTTVDIPVNIVTAGTQNDPAIASNNSGAFVVVWSSNQSGNYDILAQRYDKYGRTLGAQITVNTYAIGNQVNPDVAMDAFGNFIVTWSGAGSTDDTGVYARMFDTYGMAAEPEFRVNQYLISVQDESRVAMDADGDFVVTWTSYSQDSDKDGIFARRYNVSGVAQGNEFQVNTTSMNRQDQSDVAMDDAGNFVVVWESDQQDGSGWGIYGQRYNVLGQRLGTEFRVANTTTGNQVDAHVALDSNGDFAAVWSSFNQDGSGYGVYARRYNAAGAAQGNEFRVNGPTVNYQYQPDIAMDASGNFVVTWSAYGQDGTNLNDYGVFAHMYRADGSENGTYGEFRINATTVGNQVTPAISVDLDGDFSVAWVGPDADGTGVFARAVAVNQSTYLPVEPLSPTGQMKGKASNVLSTNPTPPTPTGPATFAITSPASGTFAAGQPMTISWTAANVTNNDVISICLDKDNKLLNGNERWFTIDRAALEGTDSITIDTTGMAAGNYYVGGYMFDKSTQKFTQSYMTTAITIPAPPVATFTLNGPASGTFAAGQPMTISWTAANVTANNVVSICLDKDAKLFNGNERWITIDKAMVNGADSITFDPAGMAAGNYYVAGYMYDKAAKKFTNAQMATPITIPAAPVPTFSLSGLAMNSPAAGQPVTVTWTAANTTSNNVISLCLDKDTKLFSGNETWVAIDSVNPAAGTYTFNLPNLASGTYYIGGYMFDKAVKTFTNSPHVTTPIVIPAASAPSTPTFTLTGPTSGTYAPGTPIVVNWTAANVTANNVVSICIDKDTKLLNGNERWITIDKNMINGADSVSLDPAGMAPGTYYVGGYMYDKVTKKFTDAHMATPITIAAAPAPTFNLTGPTSGTFSAGQLVTITWAATNVSSNNLISLCIDKDTQLWNNNERWITVDANIAANGSFQFNLPGLTAGTYYIGGYMYDKVQKSFTNSHLTQPITVAYDAPQTETAKLLEATDEENVLDPQTDAGNAEYLALADKFFSSDSSERLTDSSKDFGSEEEVLTQTDDKQEVEAIDRIFQDQNLWLEKAWMA
jgi:hypothetical protein